MRVPKHIGIIPDGNRRWAEANKMPKEKGYECGINPGLILFKLCKEAGIKELTYYGFTTDKKKWNYWLLAILNLPCFQRNCINIRRDRTLVKEELKLIFWLIMVGSGT
jgi:undecaprenyl diphosphate synthase